MEHPIKRGFEQFLFASRWLMAPFYLGLVFALLALLVVFGHIFIENVPALLQMNETSVVLWLLGLIDLSLMGNLLLTVILAGYKNFVSQMDAQSHPDWPQWINGVDFAGTKLKLIQSIVAISSIHLLEIFMLPEKLDPTNIGWLIGIQATILMSGVFLAVMDYIGERSKPHEAGEK
jgi:uncharacterized protein (TIGR00645 family)